MEPFFDEYSQPMDYSYSNTSNDSMQFPSVHGRFANDFEVYHSEYGLLYSSSAGSNMSAGYAPSEPLDDFSSSIPMALQGYMDTGVIEYQEPARPVAIPTSRSNNGFDGQIFPISPMEQSPVTPGYMTPRRRQTQQSESDKPTRQFPCENCGKSFTRVADVKRHQASVHFPVLSDCPMEACPRKGKNGFPRRDHLVEHLRSYHHVDIPKRAVTKRKVSPMLEDTLMM